MKGEPRFSEGPYIHESDIASAFMSSLVTLLGGLFCYVLCSNVSVHF